MAMAKHRALIGGLLGALALAGPAQAQAPAQGGDDHSALAPTAIGLGQPKSDDEIVVTARPKPSPAEIREQARAITAQSAQYNYPLAMFQSQVCPGIVGMPAAMANIVVDRIRFNAERVGLKTAPLGKCDANILVIFVRNGHGVIKDLSKSSCGPSQQCQILQTSRPCRRRPVPFTPGSRPRSAPGRVTPFRAATSGT